jgi:hypothetical protein
VGTPALVDSVTHDTVARIVPVRPVVENQFDAAMEDNVEVQAVGVVERRCCIRRELDE